MKASAQALVEVSAWVSFRVSYLMLVQEPLVYLHGAGIDSGVRSGVSLGVVSGVGVGVVGAVGARILGASIGSGGSGVGRHVKSGISSGIGAGVVGVVISSGIGQF